MKRILIGLAAFALCATWYIAANADGMKIVEKSLAFQRIDSAYPGGSYVTSLSDGSHNIAGQGVAVAVQDTAIVNISDHWYRSAGNYPRPFPGAGAASDSVWAGTLVIEGSSATIDTIWLFKDVSPDGVNWSGNDSLAYHLVTGQVAVDIVAAASDSIRPILASTGQAPNQVQKRATISFFAHPGMTRLGITGQALMDVNFIRFRVHMSPGDYAAAGTTNGLRGSFRYPTFNP